MPLSFTVDDVLSRQGIEFEQVLQGTDVDEKQKATDWSNRLGDIEKANVLGSVAMTLAKQEIWNDKYPKKFGFSLIGAGSSIHSQNFIDIDLFMIPETFKHGRTMQRIRIMGNIGAVLERQFNCRFSFLDYPEEKLELDEETYGKPIQMSLLMDKFDFEFPRDGKQGDLVYRPLLDSEQLIQLNKEKKSNMVVIARSYVFDTDYPESAPGDLIVNPDDIVEFYRMENATMTGDIDKPDYYIIERLDEMFEKARIQTLECTDYATPIKIRKILQRECYSILKSSGSYSGEHSTDMINTNYLNALINKYVKHKFAIT